MISKSTSFTQDLKSGSVNWLTGVKLDTIFETFKSAFSNYPISFNLNKEQFKDRFYTRLKMEKGLSPGFFYENILYAFIFTSVRDIEGVNFAYNGGTGVIPAGRGNGLVYRLYDKLLPKLESIDVRHSILEVLEKNEKALHVYNQCGFKKKRSLESFQLSPFDLNYKDLDQDITINETTEADINRDWWDTDPGFLERHFTPEFDKIISARKGKGELGYIIFNPGNGRISQIAVNPDYRRLGIGSNLIKAAYNNSVIKNLTIINVDSSNNSAKNLFKFSGFNPYFKQFEMVLSF